MRRFFTYLFLLAVPAGFFLAALQAYEYQQLSQQINRKEHLQRELLESNRRVLTELSREQAPNVVVDRALQLGMSWPKAGQIERLVVLDLSTFNRAALDSAQAGE